MQLCINGHSHRIVEHTAGQVGIKLCHHIGQDLRLCSFQNQAAHTFFSTNGAPDLCQTEKPHLTGLIQFGCLICRRAALTYRIGHDCKQLTALGWTFYEKYYVLAIYRKLQNCPGSLAEEISHILGEKVYEFEDYYISILHSDWKTELYALFGRNFPELKALVQRTDMYASLSYGFFDIINAATAMKQATRCIEIIRKFSWSQRINGYGDMVISHLIDTALACGEITLDSVCHPIALKIREYDDKNGTDLLDVLATYIYSGLSVKISSEYLHMHINTVYQRIHKLEEDFGIDFSDRRIVTMLHISIIAMAYRGDYPADRYL